MKFKSAIFGLITTSAGEKLVAIVGPADVQGRVLVRKWRYASKRWTQPQRLAATEIRTCPIDHPKLRHAQKHGDWSAQ